MKSRILSHRIFLGAIFCLFLCLYPSGRLGADGFQLPSHNAGTWGNSPAGLIAEIEKVLQDSGFIEAVTLAGQIASDVGQGKVPTIDDLAGVIEGDIQNRVDEAVAQASQATGLLDKLDVEQLGQLFTTLLNEVTKDEEFAFTIPGGRVVFRRDLPDLSLCATIAGPGGARVTLGMSNGAQLCGNPAERFVNPTRQATLFVDLALGYSNIQARRSLLDLVPVTPAGSSVSIQGTTYFKIHDDWVQLRFAGNDPQSLSLKLNFVVGVRGGVSAKIQAELEGQFMMELEVKPHQVATMLADINGILIEELGSNIPSSVEAAPATVAAAMKKVFDHLKGLKDSGEEFGEFAISMAVDGGLGVGIWDTGINVVSVGAQLKIGVPLEAVFGLQASLLEAQIIAGFETATQVGSLMEAMSEGRLDSSEMDRQLGLIGLTARDFALRTFAAYPEFLQQIELEYESGIYGLGDIGQAASETIPVLVMTVEIPIGQMLADIFNGGLERFVDGVAESVKAVAMLAESIITTGLEAAESVSLGQMIQAGGLISPPSQVPDFIQRPRGNPPVPPTIAEWEEMATDLLDEVVVSFRIGAIGIEGASMGGIVRLFGGAAEVTHSIFHGALKSAVAFNEKPLLDALRAAPAQLEAEALDLLIFNLQRIGVFYDNSIGLSGTVGAEAALGLGASIALDARLKASLLLLALNHPGYNDDDGTLLVGIDIPVQFSGAAGVSLGEGVEFSAEGGFTAGMSLLGATLKAWGRDLPLPAGLNIAGFEVIDFEGTRLQNGLTTGSGWIVLPHGGLVRADRFTLSADNKILDGVWSGVLELGPLGEISIVSGNITDNGLTGSFRLDIGPDNFLSSDFILKSNGLLFGEAAGNLNVAGLNLANVQLSLAGNGAFVGSASTRILGSEFASTNISLLPAGQLGGSFSGSLNVGNQVFSLSKLEIRGDSLVGSTTMDIAGQKAVELLLNINESGIFGSFVNDLNLIGAGSSKAWAQIADPIEIFGELDGDFLTFLENLFRDQLLAGVSDVRQSLEREQANLDGYRNQVSQIDNDMALLRVQILNEQETAREAAEIAVREADLLVTSANAELDKAIEDVRKISGSLAGELDKAEAAFQLADSALSKAQADVNNITGEINRLDAWYNSQNVFGKAFFAGWYGGQRLFWVTAQATANGVLNEARNIRNAAQATLQEIQRSLSEANELIALRNLKNDALADARAKADEARANLENIAATIVDPTLDIRYIAMSLSRDAVLQLIAGAEKIVEGLIASLNAANGLINFINLNGEAALVKVDKAFYRSTLANVNNGLVEIIVDAVVLGEPQQLAFQFNLGNGQSTVDIASATRLIAPDLYPETSWTVAPWTDDASSGISANRTLWAYQFNSAGTAMVQSVPVVGLPGVNPSVSGHFSMQDFGFTFSGDQNLLTAGSGGSPALASNFIYGAFNGVITFEGLTPGDTYRATFLSVGFDEPPYPRSVTFGSPIGNRTIEQNRYGNNHGIRIEHTFTASANTHTVTLNPTADGTFHLYAMALSTDGEIPMTYADWQLTEFGADSYNPRIAGGSARPMGDNFSNFLRYALRASADDGNPPRFTLPTEISLPSSIEARQFTFPYQSRASDVIYRIRQSGDLVTWTDVFQLNTATGTITQLPGVNGQADPNSQTVTVNITDLSLFTPPSFWTLTVQKP